MRAVVTGSSKGIGKAIAYELASMGYDLVLCSRSQSEIDLVCQNIQNKYKVHSIGYQIDMSIKDEVTSFGETIREKYQDIEILINNAGVFLPGEILKEDDHQLETMIQTNLYSAYHLTRSLSSIFLQKKKGHIINMCSIASKIAYPNGGSYSISKFALLGFSKVLREELKDKGIKVTSILPGATWSDSWKGVDLPEERLMQAKDIAKVVRNAIELGDSAVVEEIVIRPQLGDL